MPGVIVRRHTPFAIVILAHQRLIDVGPGAPFRQRIWHACRLLKVDQTLHTERRRVDVKRPLRSQNDKNKRILQEGFETSEMNSPQEDRCEHS